MTKFKKLAALIAVSMLGIQLMGAGTAFAGKSGASECDFGSDNLEVTIDDNDVAIRIDEDGLLQCDDNYSGSFTGVADPTAASAIDSLTVEMDRDDSTGNFWILLDDDGKGSNTYVSDWPDFDTFDVALTTRLIFDGSNVDDAAGNKLRVVVGKSTFSFSGTSGTYTASSLEWADGKDDDYFDASKATVRVYVDGEASPAGSGDDVVKGGLGNDRLDLTGATGDVIVYGGAGNDYIKTGSGDDQGWGGEGADTINLDGGAKDVAAPGAGDDDVDNAEIVSYGDLTGGIEWTSIGGVVETDGAAGDDEFSPAPGSVTGSAGDDVMVDKSAAILKGGAGDDFLKFNGEKKDGYASGGTGNDLVAAFDNDRDNVLYGSFGNDVLRGFGGNDDLHGGPGQDQAWCGIGSKDQGNAEVMNRCEYIKN